MTETMSKLDEMMAKVAEMAAEAMAINSDLEESGDEEGASWYAEAQAAMNKAALVLSQLADKENGR